MLLHISNVKNNEPLILRGLRAPSRQGSWDILHAHTTSLDLDLQATGTLSGDLRARMGHLLTRGTFLSVPSTLPATNALVNPVSVANLSACGGVSRFNGRDNTAKLSTIKYEYDGDKSLAIGLRVKACLLYTSPSPRDQRGSRMPSSA